MKGVELMGPFFTNRPQTFRKPVKIIKIRYISVITQKSVIFKESKIDFKSTGYVTVSLTP